MPDYIKTDSLCTDNADNTFEWKAVSDGVCLTKYNGLSAELTVPSEYPEGSGQPVVELCGTFSGNEHIKKIIIPNTVRSIGDHTFDNCLSLGELTVPNSVGFFAVSALNGCRNVHVYCSYGSAVWNIIEELPVIQGIIADPVLIADAVLPSESISQPESYVYEIYGDAGAGYDVFFCDSMPEPDMSCPEPNCAPMMPPSVSFGKSEAVPPMMAPSMAAPPMPAPSPAQSAQKSVKVKPVRSDAVSFSALSPETVERGTYSTISVYMYTKSQRKIVEKAIKAAKQSVVETSKGGFKATRGSEVTIELCSDDVQLKDNRETREWNGKSETFDFMFFTPEDYSKKQIGFTCYVYFNGIQITRLSFAVSLRAAKKRVLVKVKKRDNRHVFISYSHKDVQRVLEQLIGIQEIAPRMTFWMDSQSMEAGDLWRKEIKRAIDNADALFLFWSVYSKNSSEVEKEWRYALSTKGVQFITPVPLDPTEVCPPPHDLGELHFSHRSYHRCENIDKLNFRNSRNVRIVK